MKPKGKRIQSSDSEEDSNKKPKLSNTDEDDDDGSSSDSSIGEYLKPADKIDLNSDFFEIKPKERVPSFYLIERNILSGVTCLEEEDSENETKEIEKQNECEKQASSHLQFPQKSEEKTVKPNLQKLHKVKKKHESKKKNTADESINISNLLAIGEAKGKVDNVSDMDDDEDSELENWEEVKNEDFKEEKSEAVDDAELNIKDGVQITLELPSAMRKKKGVDLMATIKRRLNRRKKEIQIFLHKVHLLSWLGHGNYINSILNDTEVFGMALSLLPSEQCYPPERTDLNYLEHITRWYTKTINLLEKPDEVPLGLAQSLKLQISKKEASSKRNLVFIFVCMLRSLGIQCRVVFNFVTVPLRPPSTELCSLSTKPENNDCMIKVKSEKTKIETKDAKESPQLNISKSKDSKKRVSFVSDPLTYKKIATPTKSKTKDAQGRMKSETSKTRLENKSKTKPKVSKTSQKHSSGEVSTRKISNSQKKANDSILKNAKKTRASKKTEVSQKKTVLSELKNEEETKSIENNSSFTKQKKVIENCSVSKNSNADNVKDKKPPNKSKVSASKSHSEAGSSKLSESKRKHVKSVTRSEKDVSAQEMKQTREESAVKRPKIELIQNFSKDGETSHINLPENNSSESPLHSVKKNADKRRSKSVSELKVILEKLPETKKTKKRIKSTIENEGAEKRDTVKRSKPNLAALLKTLKPINAKGKKATSKVDKNQNAKVTARKVKKTGAATAVGETDSKQIVISQVDGPLDDEKPSGSRSKKPNIKKLKTVTKSAAVTKEKESTETKRDAASTSKPNIGKLKAPASNKNKSTLSKATKERNAPGVVSQQRSLRSEHKTVKYTEENEDEISDDDFLPRSSQKSLSNVSLATSSKYFSPPIAPKTLSPLKLGGNDVRDDIVKLLKGRIAEQKHIDRSKLAKSSKMKREPQSDEEGSDYVPEEIPKKKAADSDDDFHVDTNKAKRRTSAAGGTKVKRRIQPIKKGKSESSRPALSSDSEGEVESPKKGRKGNDVWLEVFLEAEERWISVDVIKCQVHCVSEIYSRASTPVAYIVAWNNNNSIKDVTRRYCPQWNTVTRKLRIDAEWWQESLKPFLGEKTIRDREEDEELMKQQLEQPLPKTVSEYKDHPLYVLRRHLLKFQAIYPPDAVTLGFIRNEPVYARDCVHTLHSREIWVKHAKVVRLGEKPYKIVKARPKYDKLSGNVITDQPLEIFGHWQVDDYIPPTAENGIVPRNAYGNVELFKACMLPKGTVHLQLPGLNKVARKMNIDCAPAVVGFDFHSGFSHPTFDGFVVCEEFSEKLVEAYLVDQEEQTKKEQEKFEKRVYGNWKRLIRGLLIRERLKIKYNYGEDTATAAETASTSTAATIVKKKSNRPKFISKKYKVCNQNESNSD